MADLATMELVRSLVLDTWSEWEVLEEHVDSLEVVWDFTYNGLGLHVGTVEVHEYGYGDWQIVRSYWGEDKINDGCVYDYEDD